MTNQETAHLTNNPIVKHLMSESKVPIAKIKTVKTARPKSKEPRVHALIRELTERK